ncbi:sorting nexin-16-like isoform X2 [Eriocheir sinensis]|nr:sorting nexin-16-like isoform X2 [Eriocheir sinensis]XP_050734495.1 sorting nexin-16-like isoform X2 [Eriocheir sinensis]XP_050734496.1 sorting nexin-16-like isoform X2 [Eriocheir sinensis]
MSARIAAISRSRAASRECTPTHSRAVSRVPSSEELNEGRVIINPVQEALHSHPLSTSQNPSRRPSQSDPSHRWGGSSSNLTSTDSTPSSDIADSGQATDSPLTGNINALGFPSTAEDASPCQYRMPIVGYEVLEERARFTVFKIQVFHQPTEEHWFVFRRYTDFVRLNKALKKEFPRLRFALPPKRWFGDNFDPIFLEDRQLGLQAFIDNVVGHTVIREKKCVRDFFCLDDPLGTQDTLAESRAMCQSLEETVSDLQDRLREKDGELAVLRSQVNFLMVQQQTLVKALRLECDLKSPVAPERGSTHDLNLALLNICERTLDGRFINNQGATGRNGANGTSGMTSPVRRGRVHSTVESPLRRTLEKAFLPRSCSHNTLSPGHSGTAAVSGTQAARALILTEGEDGASR